MIIYISVSSLVFCRICWSEFDVAVRSKSGCSKCRLRASWFCQHQNFRRENFESNNICCRVRNKRHFDFLTNVSFFFRRCWTSMFSGNYTRLMRSMSNVIIACTKNSMKSDATFIILYSRNKYIDCFLVLIVDCLRGCQPLIDPYQNFKFSITVCSCIMSNSKDGSQNSKAHCAVKLSRV